MRVFLSHASESKETVRRIAARFPKHVDVWLDQDELSTGTRFPEHIERAIREECDFVLVFIDEWALRSEWVRREIALGLEREADLLRTFVLPVLLQPVGERRQLLGLPEDVLYLEAFDLSEAGLRDCGERLCEQLFSIASRLVELLRSQGRRQLLGQFAAEATAFKQAAFLWLASMGNSLAVLSTNQAAFDQVKLTLAEYNRVADGFIPKLNAYRDRITAAWSRYRGLTREVRELTEFIENDVYRGALYRLNEVLEMIHALDAAGGADAAAIARQDAVKEALIQRADAVLHEMAQRSTDVVAELEQEV